jgi:hypothetical protein
MNPKLLLLTVISGFLFICNISAATDSICHTFLEKNAIYMECVVTCASWEDNREPSPLPKYWQKHKAKYDIIVPYAGGKVYISRGDTYFTYKGKVAIGWHGTYNPPRGM